MKLKLLILSCLLFIFTAPYASGQDEPARTRVPVDGRLQG